MWLRDRASNKRRQNPVKIKGVAREYENQLTKIARHVGHVINVFEPGKMESASAIKGILDSYARNIDEWARRVAFKMVSAIAKQDEKAWLARSAEMSRQLQREIRTSPTGDILRRLMSEQVALIKSIPIEAAQRVQEFTLVGLNDSTRSSEIVKAIQQSGHVAASRARLIARTETGRTASLLTQARAEHIGAEAYIWRTSEDGDVRDSHREMDGKVIRWDSPPTLSDGTTTHAGQIYNCRCYPEPILTDE